jgi:hypothetical protein
MAKQATTDVFITILTSKLIASDKRQAKNEAKKGYPVNIWRLSHYMGAVSKIREDLDLEIRKKVVSGGDDKASLLKLIEIAKRHFTTSWKGEFDLSPPRNMEKQIHKWLNEGVLPKLR